MNKRYVMKIIGVSLVFYAAATTLSLIVSVCFGENPTPFATAMLAALVLGLPLSFIKPGGLSSSPREGFMAVALSWIVLSLLGSLPYILSGTTSNVMDGIFESVSGFTTTGATVIGEIESLPKGIMFWRSFSNWIGGMGVLVFMLAIIPALGGKAIFLVKAETTGPAKSKIVPRIAQNAKILYFIYIAMTALLIVILSGAGMPLFDAIVHGFSTAGTGGFSNRNLSVGAYHEQSYEIIVMIFMVLFSVSYVVFYRLYFRAFKKNGSMEETRSYLFAIIAATLLVSINIFPLHGVESFRRASFQTISFFSTTGFHSVDYNRWPFFSKAVLMTLAVLGACGGSTAGGIKMSRIIILIKSLKRELVRAIHPRRVSVIKLNGEVCDNKVIESAAIFVFAYFIVIASTVFVVSLENMDFETSLGAAVSCMSNVGPSFGAIGTSANYESFSVFAKAWLSFVMVIGRLEIFPIVALLNPSAWKRI